MVKQYLSEIGRKGGSVSSLRKKLAAKEREAKKKKLIKQLAKNRKAKVSDVTIVFTKAWNKLKEEK